MKFNSQMLKCSVNVLDFKLVSITEIMISFQCFFKKKRNINKYSMYKQNWPPAQKYAINKKSTIFTQFLWHFVKMTIPWDDHFGKVSSKLGENCGFFINSIFLGMVSISLGHTVVPLKKSTLKWNTVYYVTCIPDHVPLL